MNIWTDEEKRILREVYPYEGAIGTMAVLSAQGYARTDRATHSAAARYGVMMLPETLRQLRAGNIRAEMDVSPDRPLTLDSVEMVHWFAGRGFPPRRIAGEINRPVSVIHEALQLAPPAIDDDPYWPRRDNMIVGRAIA